MTSGDPKPRTSAGTQSFSTLLRHPSMAVTVLLGRDDRRTAADIAYLESGAPMAMVASLERDGKFVRGQLLFNVGDGPIVWEASGRLKTQLELAGRVVVSLVRAPTVQDRPLQKGVFRIIEASRGGEALRLAVPTVDVALLRAAFSRANAAVVG